MPLCNMIPVHVFKKELLDLLEETFENTQGIFLDRNTSLFPTLDALSAEQASRAMGSQRTTIAGHVEHMRFYLHILTGCIQGQPPVSVDWEESWQLRSVDEQEWRATRQRLRDEYHATVHSIRELDTWNGEDDIGAALAILAHTSLHLGSIRQLLNRAKDDGEIALAQKA